MNQEFTTIFKFCQANGALVNKAKSAYGADRWEVMVDGLKLVATLEDDGYTRAIITDNLVVRHTCGHEQNFEVGTEVELEKIFVKIINFAI
jgi:hypothetical protein